MQIFLQLTTTQHFDGLVKELYHEVRNHTVKVKTLEKAFFGQILANGRATAPQTDALRLNPYLYLSVGRPFSQLSTSQFWTPHGF